MTLCRQFLLAPLICLAAVSAVHADETPRPVGYNPRKHLVVDPRAIREARGLVLALGQVEKDPNNPLLKADQPWENSLNNLYPNVAYDAASGWQLWYKCVLADQDAIAKMEQPKTIHDVGWFLLYGASRDGLKWERPPLGQIPFDGSRENNIAARDTPNVGVFRDERDADPARRYKMIYDVGLGEMRVRFSPDGKKWSEPIVPVGLGRVGDTHNNAFWDERLKRYVLITRMVIGERLVARSESDDFIHWEVPQLVLRSTFDEGKGRQTYCMPAFPCGSGYVGFAMMYNVAKDRTVDCELTWSPDGEAWQRVLPGTPFIPRGPAGSYDAGCIYAQANPPQIVGDKMHVYYGGSTEVHTGWKRHCQLSLATLHPDGFVAYKPEHPNIAGIVFSRPMIATDEPLRITADIPEGTRLQIRVLHRQGFDFYDHEPLKGKLVDAPVRWNGKSLDAFKGEVVEMIFRLQGGAARFYSISGTELLPPPIVSPATRHFDEEQEVTLSLPPGVLGEIHYTLDKVTPSRDSPRYTGPFKLTETTRLTAKVFLHDGEIGSANASAEFIRRERSPAAIVERVATFAKGDEGWTGQDKFEARSDEMHPEPYATISRAGPAPFAVAGAKASDGAFVGDWPAKFGGGGAEISFRLRAEVALTPAIELWAGDVAGWSYSAPALAADQKWHDVRIRVRHDWNDAEARAAGWRPAANAFDWQTTIKHVGRLVVVPRLAGEAKRFDLAEVRVRTIE